jgi:succinyl-CoA synthetase alpha subunit
MTIFPQPGLGSALIGSALIYVMGLGARTAAIASFEFQVRQILICTDVVAPRKQIHMNWMRKRATKIWET